MENRLFMILEAGDDFSFEKKAALDAANRYAMLFRLQNAKKPETRARNLAKFIAMLRSGEKLHA